MQLKIWCLLTARLAATLAPGWGGSVTGTGASDLEEPGGHRVGVLDVGILDRGRNILSLDRNGWLRLWDVSTQICLSAVPIVESASRNVCTVGPVLEATTCLALKQHTQVPPELPLSESEPWFYTLQTSSELATEVGTADSLVAVGLGGEACVKLYESANRSKGCVALMRLPNSTGSIEACAFTRNGSSHDYSVWAGAQKGDLAAWDLRNPGHPLVHLSGEKGAVLQLEVTQHSLGRLAFVGRSDGRVQVHDATETISGQTLELTGVNCEPLCGLRVSKDLLVWTASRSGQLRCYRDLAIRLALA